MMTLTLVLVFISAFFTDIIGIHAIFGKLFVSVKVSGTERNSVQVVS